MPELGHMRTARRDDTSLFRLSGEFDLSNAWKIADALRAAIEYDDRDIVVDLTEVSFMDAQLLRVLMKAKSDAERADLALVVIPPASPAVGRVVGLIDFDVAA